MKQDDSPVVLLVNTQLGLCVACAHAGGIQRTLEVALDLIHVTCQRWEPGLREAERAVEHTFVLKLKHHGGAQRRDLLLSLRHGPVWLRHCCCLLCLVLRAVES